MASLTRQARRVLTGNTLDATGDRSNVNMDKDPAGDERELRVALEALGERLSSQVKEVAKKSRNLEALIDGLLEPVIVTGEAQRVLLCNRAAELLLGVEQGQLVGRDVRELFTRQEVMAMHEAARRGEIRAGQVTLTTSQGPRTFQVRASPLPAAWGEGVYGAVLVLRDVTELAQAVQKQTDFVANASHELRTPVAALRIAVETLQDMGDEPEPRERFLNMCAAHVQRLEEMIRDLLDLSRAEAHQLPVRPKVIDFADLEHSLRLIFEPICAERGLKLRFAIERTLAGTKTDPKLLQLMLRNLIDNATKFAKEATTIDVRLKRQDDERGAVMRLEVQDQGQGIPLSQQERVFERFFQVDSARTGVTGRRGSGLGLAIVKHAVKALEGEVGLDSIWGVGTTVWVEVPVIIETATAVTPEPEAK